MSKVTLEFDTVGKTLSVVKDGKTMDNVRAAYFSNYYDDTGKFYAEIIMSEENKDDGTRLEQRLCAEDDKDKKKKKKKSDPNYKW